MAKRVGLFFWLVLGFLVALMILGSSASAYKIAWKTTGGVYEARHWCNHIASGEVGTAETSMTDAATSEAFAAIFTSALATSIPNDFASGCYIYSDGCDEDKDNWIASVCNDGSWSCYAAYGHYSCYDNNEGSGTWKVIAADSCGDGYCTGAETKCSCAGDCGTATYCPSCGNGVVDTGEQCESPGTSDNSYCPQTASQCYVTMLGTRDAYGNCNSTCGCVSDTFRYSCVKGQCGANCSSPYDCSPSNCSLTYNDYCAGNKLIDYNSNRIMDYAVVNNSAPNTCTSSCSCTNNIVTCPPPTTTASCVKGVCGAVCTYSSDCPDYCDGNTRYYSGACSTSGCTCSYSQQDCGSTAACSGGACVPKPLLWVSFYFYPKSTVNVGEQTILKGYVTCSNADCGNILVYAQNTSGTKIDVISGLSVIGSYPYNCSYLSANISASSSCFPNWSITGLSPGSYPLNLIAAKSGGGLPNNESNFVNLSVIEIPTGNISAYLSLDSPTVTVGTATTARATISCSGSSGAYCGNITHIYLIYDISALSIMPSMSQSCGEMWWNSQPCSVNWTINSIRTGTYNVSLKAISNKTSSAGDYKILSVNERPVGVLQIQSLYLVPSGKKIFTGENATLGAEIICKSSDNSTPVSCGLVTSYARYNGTKITNSGPLSVANPEISCGHMYSAGPYYNSTCSVNWSIGGNYAGSYPLDIAANSSSADVQNVTSDSKPMLTVSKNLGALSIPSVQAIPSQINKTSTTTLSATINCTSSYCGTVNVTLWVDSKLLSSVTPVGVSQNQKTCTSFPCNLEWTLTGNSVGSFAVNVKAVSNESIYAYNSTNIAVIDPLKPSLGLSVTMPAGAISGQPVQISANVTCYAKDCLQVIANLAYKSTGWVNVTFLGKIYSQDQNPLAFNLSAGQSYQASWLVNFTEPGNYEMGVFANGSVPGITNAQQIQTVNVSDTAAPLVMEIRSPSENAAFLRGDFIVMKAKVTRNGIPAGITPSVVSMPGMFNLDLNDDGRDSDDVPGDGIYGGIYKIPKNANPGEYRLVFTADQEEKSVYVQVGNSLSATINTDNTSYVWGEKIVISGEVTKRGQLIPASIQIDLQSPGWSGREKNVTSKTGAYFFVYDNRFMPNKDSELSIRVSASDTEGNSGLAYRNVNITEGEKPPYSISFAMQKQNYSRGETMPIALQISGEEAPQDANVTCKFIGDEINLSKENGIYRRSYSILPNATIEKQSLSCSAGGPKPTSGNIEITIEPMYLKILVVNPRMLPNNILYVFSDNSTVLAVDVRYPDGTPVTDAVLQVTVGNKTTNMTHMGSGSYNVDVMFTGSGVSDMILAAQDSQGNHGDSNISLVVNPSQFNWWWLLLIPLGMGILFALWIYKKSKEPPKIEIHEKIIKLPTVERVREIIYRPVAMPQRRADPETRLRQELSRLEEKAGTTKDAKDLAEQQYYKRQIDEATFNKLMQSYEEKLIEIDAGIRQKRKELAEMGAE